MYRFGRSLAWSLALTLLSVLGIASLASAQEERLRAGAPVNAAAGCSMPAPNACRIHIDPFVIPLQFLDSVATVTVGWSANGDATFDVGEPLLYSHVQDQDRTVRPPGEYIVTPPDEMAVACGSTGRVIVSYSYNNGSSVQTAEGAGISELLVCPDGSGLPLAVGAANGLTLAGESLWSVAGVALLVLAAGAVTWRNRRPV